MKWKKLFHIFGKRQAKLILHFYLFFLFFSFAGHCEGFLVGFILQRHHGRYPGFKLCIWRTSKQMTKQSLWSYNFISYRNVILCNEQQENGSWYAWLGNTSFATNLLLSSHNIDHHHTCKRNLPTTTCSHAYYWWTISYEQSGPIAQSGSVAKSGNIFCLFRQHKSKQLCRIQQPSSNLLRWN